MEKLYELQQEKLLDLYTGGITQEEFNKIPSFISNRQRQVKGM